MRQAISTPHVVAHVEDSQKPEVAVIVPVYMGAAFLNELVKRLHETLQTIHHDYQIILVDDRGPDNSWELIEEEAQADPRVIGVKLSRNFGQHPAISAGIAHSNANWYVVMDCDLQDPPEQIERLYKHAQENDFDIVIAKRETSGLGQDRNLGSKLFNGVLRWASDLDVSSKYGNYRIFSDKVAHAFRAYPEQLRFFPALMSHLGFAQDKLLMPRDERPQGKSSYSLMKLAKLALENIIAYSEKPLWFSVGIGLTMCGASTLYGLYILIRALFLGFDTPGFATIVTLITFFGGVQLFLLSLVGLYVGRAIAETRGRPTFIVDTVFRKR